MSDNTVPAGHPTPLAKHTADPMTVAVANVPILAVIEVEVTLFATRDKRPKVAPVAFIKLSDVIVPVAANSVPIVALPIEP